MKPWKGLKMWDSSRRDMSAGKLATLMHALGASCIGGSCPEVDGPFACPAHI